MDENPIEKMLNDDPLLAFSPYTSGQVKELKRVAAAILETLDSSIVAGAVIGDGFQRVYWTFWLWTLGAYEVVRTMKQAGKHCFVISLANSIEQLESRLAEIRIPFAKQEIRGKTQPVHAEPSVYDIDTESRDFSYFIGGKRFSIRALLGEFCGLFDGIVRSDIIASHRDSYTRGKK